MNRRAFIGCLAAAAFFPRGVLGEATFTATGLYTLDPRSFYHWDADPLQCVVRCRVRKIEPLECRARVLAVKKGIPVFETEIGCRTTFKELGSYFQKFLEEKVAPRFYKPTYEGQRFYFNCEWSMNKEAVR